MRTLLVPSPLSSVERLRSNISSKIPTRANYHSRPAKVHSHGSDSNEYEYDLSYRRPLLSEELASQEEEEEEEVDDGNRITPGSHYHVWNTNNNKPPKSPRTTTPRSPHNAVSTAVKRPVKKVLSAVTFLPSLRGNHSSSSSSSSYSPKNSDDYNDDNDSDSESRDDDFRGDSNSNRYLLRSMNDEKMVAAHHRQYVSNVDGQPTEQQYRQRQLHPTASAAKRQEHHPQQPHHRDQGSDSSNSSMKSFKQLLHTNNNQVPGDLHVVDFGGFDSSGRNNGVVGSSSSLETTDDSNSSSSSGSSNSEKENKVITGSYVKQNSNATSSSTTAVVGQATTLTIADSLLVVSSSSGSGDDDDDDDDANEKNGRAEQKEQVVDSEELEKKEQCERATITTIETFRTSTDSLEGLEISQHSDRDSSEVSSNNNSAPPLMRKSTDSSLAGLRITNESARSSEAFEAASSAYSGYVFGNTIEIYQDESFESSKTEDYDDERSLGSGEVTSSSTVDFDSHLTAEEKAAGVSADIPANDSGDLGGGANYMKNTFYHNTSKQQHHTLPLHPTTPVESSVMTEGQQSYITYASMRQSPAYPVAVTPTENGDVILLTPLDDVLDIGLQPTSSAATARAACLSKTTISQTQAEMVGSKPPKLMIPSLSEGNLQDPKAHLEPTQDDDNNDQEQQLQLQRVDATQIRSVTTRKKVVFWENNAAESNQYEASPTGVDELSGFEGDQFHHVQEELVMAITPREENYEAANANFLSRPPLPPTTKEDFTLAPEESEFIASEDWNLEETLEDNSVTSGPFGSFIVHEDVPRDLLEHGVDYNVIELRPSLESDCGASSSVVSSSVAQASDYSNNEVVDKPMLKYLKEEEPAVATNHSLLDMVADEELESSASKESKETCASLGSFSQIYSRESGALLPSEDSDSDSESDAPGDYFDYSHEIEQEGELLELKSEEDNTRNEMAASSDNSLSSCESADFISACDLARQSHEQPLDSDEIKQGDNVDGENEFSLSGPHPHIQASHEESVVETEPALGDDSSGETTDFTRQLVYQSAALKSSKPWTKNDNDSESECDGSDLISAPSASFSSGDSEEDDAHSVPQDYLSELELSDAADDTANDANLDEMEKTNAPAMEDFDKLNNFWVHEWKEMAGREADDVKEAEVIDIIQSNGLSDPDTDQPRFLLKKDVGDAMSEDETEAPAVVEKKAPANDNICTDCDGNAYLKIFDLDSGRETYEVISHRSYELETVEECSSEEDEEEKEEEETQEVEVALEALFDTTVREVIYDECRRIEAVTEDSLGKEDECDKETARNANELPALPYKKPAAVPEFQLKELGDLWSKIDDYQSTLEEGSTATNQPSSPLFPELDFLRVKSSKKRHGVRVKKRALVKVRSERAKFGLAHLEKGSHHQHEKRSICKTLSDENDGKPRTQSPFYEIPHLTLDTSLDGILTKALDAITAIEDGPSQVEDEEHTALQENPTLPLLKESPMKKEDFDLLEACSTKSMHPALLKESSMKSDGPSPPESITTKIDNFDGTKPTFAKDEDDHSLASKSLSVADTLTSWDMDSKLGKSADDDDGDTEDNVDVGPKYSEKNESEDKTSIQPSSFRHPELKRGQSMIVAKLYNENIELAETLAITQSELEKVSRKLEQVIIERDEIIATARFEI